MKCERLAAERWSSAVSEWGARAGLKPPAQGSRVPANGAGHAARRGRGRTFLMDLTWVTGRIAVGGGIWNATNMAEVAQAGVTHIVDMQIEFDDTELAGPHGIQVLWNPVDDDFQPKPPEIFQRGVDFVVRALEERDSRLLIHCAAGVHRAPMMTLAVLGALGWELGEAMRVMEGRRPEVDFAEVYVSSVERFLEQRGRVASPEVAG